MANILIIDDSPTEIQILSNILLRNGYEVSTADTGEVGLKEARSLKPDLILMDVVMPGLNGFQATRKLTRDPETCHIPVIIVSTKDQKTDKVWGERQGAKDYLVKPVSEKKLIDAIEGILSS